MRQNRRTAPAKPGTVKPTAESIVKDIRRRTRKHHSAEEKIRIALERELDRRDRLGITDLPDPLPHPDHIVIDIRHGNVRIMGPITRAEEAELKLWRDRRGDFVEDLAWIEEQLETEKDAQMRKVLEDEADRTRKVLDIIDTALARVPEPGSTRLLGRNG